MKTTLLSVFALVIAFSLSAQKVAKIPADKANITSVGTDLPTFADPIGSSTLYRPGDGPRSTGVNETEIGASVYDLQSNSNIQNRIYAYPDGTVAATWTMGFASTAFADRGSGYNYFNGVSWGDAPTERVETAVRTGWPSYAPLGDGEMIVSHGGGLNFSSRPVRGTGAWTTTTIPNTAGFTWPRAMTSNGKIHVITNTNAIFEGLDFAVVYMSSSDNGATWTTPAVPAGLALADLNGNPGFVGFGGDCYSWAAPMGDTIGFCVVDILGGAWVMKSFDNGLTWTKVTVFDFPKFTSAVPEENADCCYF